MTLKFGTLILIVMDKCIMLPNVHGKDKQNMSVLKKRAALYIPVEINPEVPTRLSQLSK